MEIRFERASKDDALKLIEVQNSSFYSDAIKYGQCPAYHEAEENMAELIKNAIVYKIVLDSETVGDIIIRIKENKNYYLRVICVIPAYWNLGIGTKAIAFIQRAHPDALKWSLITPHESIRNHHFYEKAGFVKVGEIVQSEKLTLWEYEKETQFMEDGK